MRSRAVKLVTRTIGIALLFSAASSFAATLYPFYLAGGLVNWSGVSTTVEAPPSSTPFEFPLQTIQTSTEDSGYHFSVGFSFNEQWSVEASYVEGPTQSVAIEDIREQVFGTDFSIDFESKLETSIFRANPVYELTLMEPVSILAKAGVARIQIEQRTISSIRPVGTGGQPLPGQAISASESETKAFASAGIKLNFLDGKIAAVANVVQYFDAIEGLDQAFEVNLFWRF
ncbi:MAG: outer membrane beta-barrel protein [Gammaproteobacteria bacterium]|nr:outer membrane beta-barrel protein [Gammaproteobacteria bacterium]